MRRREFLQLSAASAAAVFVPGARAGRDDFELPRIRLQSDQVAAFTTFDATGHRYEIATFSRSVCSIDELGVLRAAYGACNAEAGGLNHPVAVAIGPDERVYVLDHGDSQIVVFDREGQLERRIAGWGASVGDLCYPRSFAFDRSGRLWVADTLNHRIQAFDGFGVSLSCVGGLGSEVGLFNGPTALAFAPSGELHVLDAGNRRVQVFSEDGALLGSYGQDLLEAGESLAVAHDGRVCVADSIRGAVEVFAHSGSHQRQLRLRFEDGQRAVPTYLAFAPDGELHVAAQKAGRV